MFEYPVRVLKVVDGDTLEVEVDLGLRVYKRETLRLLGLNTPELRSTVVEERLRAVRARDYVSITLLGDARSDRKTSQAVAVKVQTEKPYPDDKFGRWLARVFYKLDVAGEWRCLNDELLAEKLANPYDGKGPRA